MKKILIPLVFILLAMACKSISPTPAPTPTVAPTPIVEAMETATPTLIGCQEIFELREIKTQGKPHLALSAEEWNGYLNLMGIQSLCLPKILGSPFVNADWDSANFPATGRMASIGFENRYKGSGWSEIFLLYSTYNFTIGTEFDRFASLEDRDALRNHTMENEIEINGVSGFTRFKTSMWTYEGQPDIVYRSVVFPFEDYYVAIVYNMGLFENGKEVIPKFEAGDFPSEYIPQIEGMDYLVNSMKLAQTP